MSDIEKLIAEIKQEAERAEFPIDIPVYQQAGLSPTQPILYAGNLESQLCIFARDLGKDEVFARQPLYGAAGRLVRQGLYRAIYGYEPTKNTDLDIILGRVLLTNTVPYKPPGNKAYTETVKKRFRPFLEKLLVCHWKGDKIITLGNEAFNWFSPYAINIKEFFVDRSDRYKRTIQVILTAKDEYWNLHSKSVTLYPLPHPSPLNEKYYEQFPQMFQQRLTEIFPQATEFI